MVKVPVVGLVIEELHLFLAGAIQKNLLNAFREFGERGADIKLVELRQSFQDLQVVVTGTGRPGSDGAFTQRQLTIGHDLFRIEIHARAKT